MHSGVSMIGCIVTLVVSGLLSRDINMSGLSHSQMK